MRILFVRLGRALAAVFFACGILAVAPFGQGLYADLSHHDIGADDGPTPAAFGRLSEGDLMGRLTAPRVGLDAPVYEGIAGSTLAQGPGHVPSTALPGRSGGSTNAVIAVSRGDRADRVARLMLGDSVLMLTPFGPRRYRVVDRKLLDTATFRFDLAARSSLTLLTPYPPEEIGPAPSRLALGLEAVND